MEPGKGSVVQDFDGTVDGFGVKNSMFANFVEKPPVALVPSSYILAAARALGYGANKYAPNNWRRGMKWSEVFSALQRHLLAWNNGEDYDLDTGLSHLDHAGACLAFLTEYASRSNYLQFDDRPETSLL